MEAKFEKGDKVVYQLDLDYAVRIYNCVVTKVYPSDGGFSYVLLDDDCVAVYNIPEENLSLDDNTATKFNLYELVQFKPQERKYCIISHNTSDGTYDLLPSHHETPCMLRNISEEKLERVGLGWYKLAYQE